MVKYHSVMPDRKWKRFPGNNLFYCNGMLMTANQIGILVFVTVAIVVEATLYFAFDARYLVSNIHPIGVGVIFPVIGALGMFYALAFLLKTGCIDPGIVPRGRGDEIAYQQSLGDVDRTNTAKGYVGVPARYHTVTVRGQQIRLKWCATCNVWRPPRASHCGLCNNCLENFDHHCPWVGNCVAKRNYRYFYLFLVTVSVMGLYVMGCNVTVIVLASKQMGVGEAVKTYPASLIEFGIAGLSLISVSGLAAMHTWLIARMETTNEDIKGTFNPRRQGIRNPYQQRNCCINFMTVICGPFPPSLIDRRGYIDESALSDDEAALAASYGATSSIPKLPPEQPRVQSPSIARPDERQDPGTREVPAAAPVDSDSRQAGSQQATEVELHAPTGSAAESPDDDDEEKQQLLQT